MNVQELIEKLQSLNPTDDVLIEVDHDEIISLKADRIEEELMTPDHRLATQEDLDAKKVVLLRL